MSGPLRLREEEGKQGEAAASVQGAVSLSPCLAVGGNPKVCGGYVQCRALSKPKKQPLRRVQVPMVNKRFVVPSGMIPMA